MNEMIKIIIRISDEFQTVSKESSRILGESQGRGGVERRELGQQESNCDVSGRILAHIRNKIKRSSVIEGYCVPC